MWQVVAPLHGGDRLIYIDGSDIDRASFEDSEQFEDGDSDSSICSDNLLQAHTWSGWNSSYKLLRQEKVFSLIELSARATARNFPFEVIENHQPPIPEELQLRIAYWSFPESEAEIRLYSCLACGSAEKFQSGEQLARNGNVQKVLQIGFHLSGVVSQPVPHSLNKQLFNVAISFDRGRITSCQCTCDENAMWCEHTIAVCLYRIIASSDVELRAPVSESLSRLERDQLQKFAQYLISELPQQILPTAQRLLDELLFSKESTINSLAGAPDPTAGASLSDEAKWVLDEGSLRENIKKILARYFGLSVMCFNEQYPPVTPAVSLQWTTFIQSFQPKKPEAMWNLLSIVRHMMRCSDRNAIELLTYLTEECMFCYQMIFYWVSSCVPLENNNRSDSLPSNFNSSKNSRTEKYASAHFMEEVVHLWQLVIMDPHLDDDTKNEINSLLLTLDAKVISAANKGQGQGYRMNYSKSSLHGFSGFNKAIKSCDMKWSPFYEILEIPSDPQSTNHQLMSKLSALKESSIYKLFMKVRSLLRDGQDEFNVMSILTQALHCHGYINKATKLASMLAQRILSTYPSRLRAGESDFSPLINQANSLCEILEYSNEYKRTLFEMALLGLTAPRQPARNNLDEVKVLYLEICLYKKLKSMEMTEERLTLIRHQAKKVLTCPTLRGEEVLPLLLVTYIFEVLCCEVISSSILQSPTITWAPGCQPLDADDMKLGYKCALRVLGISSNASDTKNAMLCESIRNQRKDLSLALLFYSRWQEEEVSNILEVILDRNRYNFMKNDDHRQAYNRPSDHRAHQNNFNGPNNKASGKQNPKKSPDRKNKIKEKFLNMLAAPSEVSPQDQSEISLQQKYGVSFTEIMAQQKPPVSRLVKSSDSDSGNGEGNDKKNVRLPLLPTSSSKKQQSRRPLRHTKHPKADTKPSRNVPRGNSKQNKQKRLRHLREVTESDSGQEMHFSFEKDEIFVAETEDWDNETLSLSPQDLESYKNQNEAATVAATASYPCPTEEIVHVNESTFSIQADEEAALNIVNIAAENLSKTEEERFISSFVGESSSILIPQQPSALPQQPSAQINLANEDEPILEANPENNDIDLGYSEEIIVCDNIDENINNQAHDIEGHNGHSVIGGNVVEERIVTHETLLTCSSNKPEPLLTSSNDIHEPLLMHGNETHEPLLMRANDAHGSLLMRANNSIAHKADGHDSGGLTSSNDSISSIDHMKLDINKQSPIEKTTTEVASSPDSVLLDNDFIDSNSNSLTDLNSPDTVGDDIHDDMSIVRTENNDVAQHVDVNVSSEQNMENLRSQFEGLICENETPGNKQGNESDANTLVEFDLCAPKDAVDIKVVSVSEPIPVSNKPIKSLPVKRNTSFNDKMSTPLNSNNSTSISNMSASSKVSTSLNSNLSTPNVTTSNSSVPTSSRSKKKSKKKSKEKVTMNLQSIESEAFSMFELAKCLIMLHADSEHSFEALPLAALEIGLFALNIHNYSTPNWCSRTYSTYVKWIENHSVELGVKALQMLNEKWEGVLTPTESAQIALRAARVGDASVKRTSAELVLSCLAHSQSLCSADITSCLNLCRQIGNEALERACSAVENASVQGGIQPELLFRVSREWHYLHEERRKQEQGDSGEAGNEEAPPRPPVLNNQNKEMPTVYITAEQFVQEQMHLQAQEMLGRQLPRSSAQENFPWMYPQYIGPLHHCPLPQQAVHSRRIPNIESYSIPYSNFPEELNLSEIPRYLQNCYRVGMRAMEALALPLPDERPERKYSIAPPCSEDIRWMCALSASLGPTCLKNFCKVVYNAVTSPFLLHDLALEAARHFALYNPAQLASHLRSPSVSPIVQKAMAMYTELVHHDLVFLSPAHHNDFVDLLKRTRSAFCMAPGGMTRFNDILDMIRKTYPKKRELWQQIMSGLSTA